MKKALHYFTVGLIIVRFTVWHFDNKLRDNIELTFESTNDRKAQIDSIRTLRLKLEKLDSLNNKTKNIDSLDNKQNDSIQNLKNEERRLLKKSLGQYLETKEKIKGHFKFLDLIESIVNILLVLTIGTLVFKLIKQQ